VNPEGRRGKNQTPTGGVGEGFGKVRGRRAPIRGEKKYDLEQGKEVAGRREGGHGWTQRTEPRKEFWGHSIPREQRRREKRVPSNHIVAGRKSGKETTHTKR